MKPAKAVPATAVVIGGGIIGLACAVQLRARGLSTVLLDAADSVPPASVGNAGHIAVEQIEPLASLRTLADVPRRLFCRGGALALPPRDIVAWLPFACRLARCSVPSRFRAGKAALSNLLASALPAWRRLAKLADAHELIVEDGHYVVWETRRTARNGRAFWTRGQTGTASIRELTREEGAQIAGLVSRAPLDGLRFIGTGRVRDPGALCERLATAFRKAGGQYRIARAERIALDGSHAVVGLADDEVLDADLIVVSAGIGSARLLRPLGHRVPIIAERGYHIQADAPTWPDMPPVVFEDRSMIVTPFSSGLRAASFVEFAREQRPPDTRKWERLHRHAAELRLPFTTRPREWMGTRPTLPDYLPAIGRSRAAHNLCYAFGHQHLGLTLAAITGEMIATQALEQASQIDCAPFALERF